MSGHVEARFAEWVERHVRDGTRLDPGGLCADAADAAELRRLIADYDALRETLGDSPGEARRDAAGNGDALPQFDGFRTIERVGSGGVGDVYKLEDLELGRTVAAKVLREGSELHRGIEGFLEEARSLALFEDPRIVRVIEFRRDGTPPALLMEYVEGFPLDRIARSLEYRQRARLMVEIADAIDHAHRLGVQHRDLKPANILVDSGLRPRILDFGLAGSDSGRGHGLGTPAYMAPEQLDPTLPIDARTDVYALGVVLYEVLCGKQPYYATSHEAWIEAIRRGEPELPVELEPDVPEPLQAIALKAMETEPEARYATVRDFAADLRRWLDGRPVTARPSLYRDTLSRRIQPHVEQIREWGRLKLLWPHETRALEAQYRKLEVREEEWILRSRNLSLSQIALYLGAVMLFCGGILYYVAYLREATSGIAGPIAFLALPFVGINVIARRLYRGGREAVGMAYHLAAVLLLPLFALVVLDEAGWWPAVGGDLEIATDWISNRRLQVVTGLAAAWGLALAFLTRTITFSTYTLFWTGLFYIAVLGDFGFAVWMMEGSFDALGLRLLPLAAMLGGAAAGMDRARHDWFSRPAWVGAACTFALALELVALDGRALARIGVSLAPLMTGSEGDPILLDTVLAMAFNGVLFYGLGRLAESLRIPSLGTAAWLLSNGAPFAILQPVSWLAATGEYPLRFTWIYLGLAFGVAVLSYARQRKAFYYAGLLNSVLAIYFLTRDYGWWDRLDWALIVLAAGALLLLAGWTLHRREQPGVTRRK